MSNAKDTIQPGDWLLFYMPRKGKRYVVRADGSQFHTERGFVALSDLVGQPFGITVRTHKGERIVVGRATLHEFIMYKLKRRTQIIYPLDATFIIHRLDLFPGAKVLECGTGSGAMTLMLARAVAPDGRVVTCERRPEFHELAQRNYAAFGGPDVVSFHLGDLCDGFPEGNADAIFLDVRTPWDYLKIAWDALKPGRWLACLVPTTNQIIETLAHLDELPFLETEVCELSLRHYKPVAERLRPEDRMVAHTGYLVFTRKVLPDDSKPGVQSPERDDCEAPRQVEISGKE